MFPCTNTSRKTFKIQISEKYVPQDRRDWPAVTICPNNGFPAWQNNSNTSLFGENCGYDLVGTNLTDCVKNKTFDEEDSIKKLVLNTYEKQNVTWTEGITVASFGRCFSLNDTIILDFKTQWNLMFHNKTDALVFVHDPQFFLLSENPRTIPKFIKIVDKQDLKKYQLSNFEVVRHVLLSTHDQPCEENENYSFTACIHNWVSQKSGCRYICYN